MPTATNLPICHFMEAPQHSADYLSPEQFALATGLSLSTVHRYLKAGRLAFLQPGGRRHRVLIPARLVAELATTNSSSATVGTLSPIAAPTSRNSPSPRQKRAPAWLQRQTTKGLYTHVKSRKK
jgi:excisionase family DNA binding protein